MYRSIVIMSYVEHDNIFYDGTVMKRTISDVLREQEKRKIREAEAWNDLYLEWIGIELDRELYEQKMLIKEKMNEWKY